MKLVLTLITLAVILTLVSALSGCTTLPKDQPYIDIEELIWNINRM